MISSRKILIATLLPFKFLGMLCLYIAAKCLNKHVYVIRSDRIGHFVPDSAEAIIRLNKETDGFRRRFVFSSKPANIQWQKMVQRTLPMWPSYLFSERILRFCPFFTPVFHNATLLNSRDQFGWYNSTDFAKLQFTESEHEFGQKFLRQIGFQHDKYICVLLRDSDFLKAQKRHSHVDFAYHSYRNSDVNSYRLGINLLIKSGYRVIRIGRDTTTELKIDNPRFFDLNYSKISSDFLDIWLVAHCSGLISTGTGHDVLASIYEKKVLFINFLPLLSVHSFHPTLTAPKKLRWKSDGSYLSISEALSASYFHTDQYETNGILVEDLNEREIENIMLEFLQHLHQEQISVSSAASVKFWELYREHPLRKHYSMFVHSKAAISEIWLKHLTKVE